MIFKKINNFLCAVFLVMNFSTSFASPPGGFCPNSFDIPKSNALDFAKPKAIIFVSEDTPADVEDLPEEWDWRNVSGQNWLTRVKSQAGCGNCVMHAVSSVFEAQLKITSGWSWWEPEISIDEGFHCGGGDCSKGWWGQSAIDRGMQEGFLDQSCGSEIKTPNDCKLKECSNHDKRRWKIAGYQKINDGTLDVTAIRRALLKGPVLSGMTIPEDFPCYRWGVYRKGKNVGFQNIGHMMAIVGYSAKKKAWIVKNSWGDNWVHNGFGYLYAKDTTGFGNEAWLLNMDYPTDVVEIEGLANNQVLNGKVKVNLLNKSKKAENLNLYFTQNQKVILSESCVGASCEIEIDSHKLDDGKYEVYAQNNSMGSKSMIKTIQVVNSAPQWKSLQKTSLMQAQLTQNSLIVPIPFNVKPTKLSAVFRSKNGDILLEQSTFGVPTNLKIMWNSKLLPQGATSLELWFYLEGFQPFQYFKSPL